MPLLKSCRYHILHPLAFEFKFAAAGAAAVGFSWQEAAADALLEVRNMPEAAAEEGLPAQQGIAVSRQPRRARRVHATWR